MTLHTPGSLYYTCHNAELKADEHTIYNFHVPLFRCPVRDIPKNQVLKAEYYGDTTQPLTQAQKAAI